MLWSGLSSSTFSPLARSFSSRTPQPCLEEVLCLTSTIAPCLLWDTSTVTVVFCYPSVWFDWSSLLLFQAMASQIGRLRPRGMRESGLTIDGDPQQSRSSSEVLIQPLANLIRYGFAISAFHSLYRLPYQTLRRNFDVVTNSELVIN
jgi:hypothetical protein